MTVYTVHEPPPRKNGAATEPDRFRFVRDGFYFWAFLLAPFWMIRHRLWLVLLFYVIGLVALEAAFWALGVNPLVQFVVGVLVALLIGFEAASLRRWTLGRRGWTNLGVVIAPDLEAAERRFFDAWMMRGESLPPAQPPASATHSDLRTPAPSTDVIGLFPEPEPRR
jgi:hypothetical protein